MSSSEVQTINNKRVIQLTPPVLTEDRIIGYKAGLRPVRKGGVRLGEEKLGNKIVFHNYGHGAGGVSVAYGYSSINIKQFQSKYHGTDYSKKIAVVGSGYVGLYTSLILRQNNYEVTVYADKTIRENGFSAFDTQNQNLPTTSQIAAGIWIPYCFDFDSSPESKETHQNAARMSYKFYENAIKEQSYKGVSFRRSIHVDSIDYIKKSVPEGIIKDHELVKVTWNGVDLIDAHYFTAVLIDGDIFLNDLKQKCINLGVKFVDKHFGSQNDVLNLEEKTIFNCAGCASGKLFNDPNIYPIKGQLVSFKTTPGVDYFFRTQIESGAYVSFYPQSNCLSVGLVEQKDDWSLNPTADVCKNIAQNAINYFQKYGSIKTML